MNRTNAARQVGGDFVSVPSPSAILEGATKMVSIPRAITVPIELAKFSQVDTLWPKILRRANPQHLRRFGISDLAFRLTCQAERESRNSGRADVRARAIIWHHVATQCSAGKSEVQTPTEQELRRWMAGTETEYRTV